MQSRVVVKNSDVPREASRGANPLSQQRGRRTLNRGRGGREGFSSAPRTTLAMPKCCLEHLKINPVWPAQQLVLPEDQECAPHATLANVKRISEHVKNCIPA